ncbi:MAG: MFS transporter [Lachnospiraceae bacterium]|nr:MFS transporter [Lachnospiraceae bacterium]MBQ8547235.1 MFS transporter [Lachnospiraceae bacterium]
MKTNYKSTIYACFVGYIVQAIINNFAPLLFLTFQDSYGIPLSKITFLVTFNFLFQLAVDLIAAVVIDKIGYRVAAVAAHVFAAAGLISMAFLPELMPDPFVGLMISVVIYALGGGLLEVLISPMVEACPTDNKEAAMSLLHSFYCWGHVGVVLLSTLFFVTAGIGHWKILAILWAAVPVINGIAFLRVPIAKLLSDEDKGMSIKELVSGKAFWIFILLMFCAGSCEQAVSQWASAFAEKGLNISKTLGDLAGPMLFAICMGAARVLYSKIGEKLQLRKAMVFCGLLCLGSYLLISLSPLPLLGLIGCGICGFSVGLLWPGTFSLAAVGLPRGGTAMFALLALAGDLGCSMGPTLVGRVSAAAGDDLKKGILVAIVLPVMLLMALWMNKRAEKQ